MVWNSLPDLPKFLTSTESPNRASSCAGQDWLWSPESSLPAVMESPIAAIVTSEAVMMTTLAAARQVARGEKRCRGRMRRGRCSPR